jgi:hypothetical protein
MTGTSVPESIIFFLLELIFRGMHGMTTLVIGSRPLSLLVDDKLVMKKSKYCSYMYVCMFVCVYA